MRKLKTTLIGSAVCVLLAFSAMGADKLVTVGAPTWSGVRDAVDAIEAYGGRVKIVYVPHFIIADIPEGAEIDLLTTRSISALHDGELDPGDFTEYGKPSRHIVTAWNNVFMGKAKEAGLDREPNPDRSPLINDMDENDDLMLLMKPPGAKVNDTSEFMLGSVVLGVILAESNGSIDPNSEDWTTAEEDNVTSEIINGLNWYVTKSGYLPLSFYTVFHYAVPTSYEPITRNSSQDYLWINECLANLGFASANEYVRTMRDSLGTEWGVLAMIADDTNDVDNSFPDGRFAYAQGGGPRFVMTYDNDGWGIADMDAVMAHEISHSFYALDEYFDAGRGCTASRGYMNVENQNSEYPDGPGGCAINKPFCLMRSVVLAVARVCNYSKGQLGWWDTDGDSIPDILDTCPETEIYEYAPDPCTTLTPAYAGSSWVTMLPNENPSGAGNDITLNRILMVEYRVDGGDWHDASPNDGTWDEGKEGYYFTTEPLDGGLHVIEARAIHTYGNHDTTFAIDTLTVDESASVLVQVSEQALYVRAQPNPFGPAVDISYSVPGEYGKAIPVSMTVYDVRGRQVTSLIKRVRSPGPGSLSWGGTYSDGSMAPSGIYFIDFVAGNSRAVKKIVMTR
jgi:hypothetical protein